MKDLRMLDLDLMKATRDLEFEGLFKSNLDRALDWLEKGAGHKYLKRLLTGKVKPRYRYIYSVNSKYHGARSGEPMIGDKLKAAHGGKEGHYEITDVHFKDGKTTHVTIKHDESGHETRVSVEHLHEMFKDEHKAAIKDTHGKLGRVARQAHKTGTDKQRRRAKEALRAHEDRYGLQLEATQGEQMTLDQAPKAKQAPEVADPMGLAAARQIEEQLSNRGAWKTGHKDYAKWQNALALVNRLRLEEKVPDLPKRDRPRDPKPDDTKAELLSLARANLKAWKEKDATQKRLGGSTPATKKRIAELEAQVDELSGGKKAKRAKTLKAAKGRDKAGAPKDAVKTAGKLRAAADKIDGGAEEALGADRKTNTHKRQREARHAIENAYREQQLAETMRNIADAVEAGEAPYLSRVSSKAQVKALESIAAQAHYKSQSKSGSYDPNDRAEYIEPDAIEEAEHPLDRIYRHNIRSLAEDTTDKAAAAGLNELWRNLKEDERAYVPNQGERDLIERAAAALGKGSFSTMKEDYSGEPKRLRKMGIENTEQLKAALLEYLGQRGGRRKADPLKMRVQAAALQKIGGYFPTPKPIVDRMVEIAGVKPGDKVLEPSAGAGHIADAIQDVVGHGEVHVGEVNSELRGILDAKGHKVVGRDALAHGEKYDHVIMNPPFEKGADMEHVQHAFENNLRGGGKVVAIMSEGPFFRQDKKATAFREWLEKNGGTSEKLPAGSFKASDRQTGVNSRLVTIQKAPDKSTARKETLAAAKAADRGEPAPKPKPKDKHPGHDASGMRRATPHERAAARAITGEASSATKHDPSLKHGVPDFLAGGKPAIEAASISAGTKLADGHVVLGVGISGTGSQVQLRVRDESGNEWTTKKFRGNTAIPVDADHFLHTDWAPRFGSSRPAWSVDEVLSAPDKRERERIAAYEEKQEAKRDRYETRAAKARGEAQRRWKAGDPREAASGIPMGQPILVGHHSEKRHRAAIKRQDSHMRAAMAADDKAAHYDAKAAGVGTGGISADDPAAIRKLKQKIAAAEEKQAHWKATNRAARMKDTAKGDAKLRELYPKAAQDEEKFKALTHKLRNPEYSFHGVGIPKYELTNNNANIRRMKQRVETLAAEHAASDAGAHADIEGKGFRIEHDADDNRVRFHTDGKPPKEIRQALKSNGFRWAPSVGAWQRQNNANGRAAAKRVASLHFGHTDAPAPDAEKPKPVADKTAERKETLAAAKAADRGTPPKTSSADLERGRMLLRTAETHADKADKATTAAGRFGKGSRKWHEDAAKAHGLAHEAFSRVHDHLKGLPAEQKYAAKAKGLADDHKAKAAQHQADYDKPPAGAKSPAEKARDEKEALAANRTQQASRLVERVQGRSAPAAGELIELADHMARWAKGPGWDSLLGQIRSAAQDAQDYAISTPEKFSHRARGKELALKAVDHMRRGSEPQAPSAKAAQTAEEINAPAGVAVEARRAYSKLTTHGHAKFEKVGQAVASRISDARGRKRDKAIRELSEHGLAWGHAYLTRKTKRDQARGHYPDDRALTALSDLDREIARRDEGGNKAHAASVSDLLQTSYSAERKAESAPVHQRAKYLHEAAQAAKDSTRVGGMPDVHTKAQREQLLRADALKKKAEAHEHAKKLLEDGHSPEEVAGVQGGISLSDAKALGKATPKLELPRKEGKHEPKGISWKRGERLMTTPEWTTNGHVMVHNSRLSAKHKRQVAGHPQRQLHESGFGKQLIDGFKGQKTLSEWKRAGESADGKSWLYRTGDRVAQVAKHLDPPETMHGDDVNRAFADHPSDPSYIVMPMRAAESKAELRALTSGDAAKRAYALSTAAHRASMLMPSSERKKTAHKEAETLHRNAAEALRAGGYNSAAAKEHDEAADAHAATVDQKGYWQSHVIGLKFATKLKAAEQRGGFVKKAAA